MPRICEQQYKKRLNHSYHTIINSNLFLLTWICFFNTITTMIREWIRMKFYELRGRDLKTYINALEETFFSDKFVFWSLEFTPPMINDKTKIEFVFELATRHDFNYVSICLGICLNLDLFSFYPSWYTS